MGTSTCRPLRPRKGACKKIKYRGCESLAGAICIGERDICNDGNQLCPLILVFGFRLRQQVRKLFGEELEPLRNLAARLVDDLLEPTTTAVTDELLGGAGPSTVLEILRGVLGGDMLFVRAKAFVLVLPFLSFSS